MTELFFRIPASWSQLVVNAGSDHHVERVGKSIVVFVVVIRLVIRSPSPFQAGCEVEFEGTEHNSKARGSLKTGSAAATDTAGGLAWQKDSVSRALGEVKAYEDNNNPSYYGDIFSFAVRAGGSSIRADKKGIVLLYQGTPA